MLSAKLTIAPDVNALASASSFIIMFTQGNKIGVTAEVSPRSKLAISEIGLVSSYNLTGREYPVHILQCKPTGTSQARRTRLQNRRMAQTIDDITHRGYIIHSDVASTAETMARPCTAVGMVLIWATVYVPCFLASSLSHSPICPVGYEVH